MSYAQYTMNTKLTGIISLQKRLQSHTITITSTSQGTISPSKMLNKVCSTAGCQSVLYQVWEINTYQYAHIILIINVNVCNEKVCVTGGWACECPTHRECGAQRVQWMSHCCSLACCLCSNAYINENHPVEITVFSDL